MDGWDDIGGRFESARAIPGLASPPRAVPFNLRLRVLFTSPFGLMAWLWLLFSLLFVAIFLPMTDLAFIRYTISDVTVTPGKIVRAERTNGKSGKRYVYANYYTFSKISDETTYQGVSYSTGYALEPGQPIRVEYLTNKPSVSRIEGLRSTEFGPAALFVLIFPLVGFAMAWRGLAEGVRNTRLLRRGVVGNGRALSSSPTGVRINRRAVYRVAYEFAGADGRRHQGEIRTMHPNQWPSRQPIAVIHDPANPARSNILDNLPDDVRFDSFGNFRDPGPLAALKISVLPIITITGYLLVLGRMFLG